jgi:hypothetical protein
MHLKALTIKNFKGIDEHGVRIEFAPITLLFGPNNAGKSTVIQALLLAQRILADPCGDFDAIEYGGYSLGTFKDYVHKHKVEKPVCICLSIEYPDFILGDHKRYFPAQPQERLINAQDEEAFKYYNAVKHIDIEFIIRYSRGKAVLDKYIVCMNGKKFADLNFDSAWSAELSYYDITPFIPYDDMRSIENRIGEVGSKITYGSNEYKLIKQSCSTAIPRLLQPFTNWGYFGFKAEYTVQSFILRMDSRFNFDNKLPLQFNDLSGDVSSYDTPVRDNAIRMFSSLFLGPARFASAFLDKCLHVGPLRKIPARGYKPQRLSPTRWAEGLAAWDFLATLSDEALPVLNNKLRSLETGFTIKRRQFLRLEKNDPLVNALQQMQHTPLDEGSRKSLEAWLDQVPELEDMRLTLHNEQADLELEPHDMGVGISQVLPVVVASFCTGLAMLEQPELHIHPKLQTTLGDIFLEAANRNRSSMFLLETHSEHIMLRLLRRIRETSEGELPESAPAATIKDVAVYYIQNNTGCTKELHMEVTPDGDFARKWPNGFFTEREEEIF